MPKATWDDLDANDIDSAEASSFEAYAGELPKGGVYRFKLQTVKKGKSKEENDKLLWIWKLDGSWKPAHKAYDGCPVFDHMPMTKSAAFRAKAAAAALGLTAAEFLKMVTDEDGRVTKIGNIVLEGKDIYVYLNVGVRREEGYDPSLTIKNYIPKDDGEPGKADDADAEDKPAKGKKPKEGKETGGKAETGKKGKKGKKDEVPF